MFKRLLSRPWAQEVVAFLILLYVELVRRSIRWEVRHGEHVEKVWAEQGAIVGCVWHGRVLMALHGWDRQRKRMVALASKSREGEIGARFARWYGIDVVRGSTRNPDKPGSKGGEKAYREMVAHLRKGGCAAITPDGPRGPRQRAGFGAVQMARDTGVPILPFTWSTSGRWILWKAWDRHCLPHFFTRGVIVWGDPIHVPADADADALEAARALLESRLNAMTREADEAVGGPVIEPDEKRRPGTGGSPRKGRRGGAA